MGGSPVGGSTVGGSTVGARAVSGPATDRAAVHGIASGVVVGSGSAGRRHARMLRTLLPELALTVVRRAGSTSPRAALAELGATEVDDLATVRVAPPVVAVVASPATHHVDPAIALLQAGSAVLVEKPLAATVQDAQRLAAAERATGHRVLLGYHLRFGDVLPEVRRLLADGAVGEPTDFHLEVGQHLAQWRPEQDPRASVTAREELGGGVLLELSHELDAVRVALGTEIVEVVAARLRHDGAPTDGRVDTVADLTLRTSAGVTGTVHLDMVAPVPFRRWRIRGSAGTVEADLLTSTVTVVAPDGTVRSGTTFDPDERERAERRLITHLLELVDPAVEPRCSSADGLAVLAVVAAARRAAADGAAVAVDPTADRGPGARSEHTAVHRCT